MSITRFRDGSIQSRFMTESEYQANRRHRAENEKLRREVEWYKGEIARLKESLRRSEAIAYGLGQCLSELAASKVPVPA